MQQLYLYFVTMSILFFYLIVIAHLGKLLVITYQNFLFIIIK